MRPIEKMIDSVWYGGIITSLILSVWTFSGVYLNGRIGFIEPNMSILLFELVFFAFISFLSGYKLIKFLRREKT